LVGCTSQQPDGFLSLRAFKPSSSESADRGRSIIQVILMVKISQLLAGSVDQSNVQFGLSGRSIDFLVLLLCSLVFGTGLML
jgi:hypothetical protein